MEEQIPVDLKIKVNKSDTISKSIKKLNEDGRHLNDDSCISESILEEAMEIIIAYAQYVFKKLDAKIIRKKQLSLYECQQYFHNIGGPEPNSENKRVFMKPDGGILFASINNKDIPILIVEDKVQGTNDILFQNNKKRQATGNAIERAAKNIRGAEMLFSGLNIFPYVIFASGCDLHHSETISKRLEMMNMGIPNHYIEITSKTLEDDINFKINKIKDNINIKKIYHVGISSIFIKSHKWDEMKHNSSCWKKDEIISILKNIIDKVFEEINKSLTRN